MTEPQQNPENEKKETRKKNPEEKQQEKDAMINLWMGNLGSENPSEKQK